MSFYAKSPALRAMLVIHIHNGQNPMNKMIDKVSDDVPVAT